MNIKSLIKLVGGKVLNLPNDFNKHIDKFTFDSRKVKPSYCFITLGSGYLYAHDAISNGASVVITDKDIYTDQACLILKVESIEDTVLKIIGYIKDKYNIPIIAVTGSTGKTSTKEMIYQILSSKYKVLKNIDNKNNYIGIGETIFELSDIYDVIVIEIGMNHAGEISRIVNYLKPSIALITNIGSSHIGNLGSIKNILNAKLEILNTRPMLFVTYLDKRLRKVKYDKKDICDDIKISHIKLKDILSFKLKYNNIKYDIKFKIPNKLYISNIILAFKIGLYFHIDIKDIINSINNFTSVKGRMNIIKKDNYVIIDDTYNSSLESLTGALGYLKHVKKKMVILGDIKELGTYNIKIHRKINHLLKDFKKRNILLYGEDVKYIDGLYFLRKEDMYKYLSILDLSGYKILVKGSHVMHMEEIMDFLNR